MMKLIFATHNEHKINEVSAICPRWIELMSLNQINYYCEIPETEDTLEGNAKIKAQKIYHFTDQNVFSEDTGLEVDCLDGSPGVHTARYAGLGNDPNANYQLLLHNMCGKLNREAKFRTIIHLIYGGESIVFEGICPGTIATVPTGNKGFGYDPVFIPKGYDQTFAQLPPETKIKLSHRSIAFDKMITFLKLTNQLT